MAPAVPAGSAQVLDCCHRRHDRLIIRDEAVHGYYIGCKYQRGLALEDEAKRAELKHYT